MAEFPALPLWTDALIGDTHHLTPAQFGAYLRLLIAAWRTNNCALPNDDVFLGRTIGDPKNWHRLKQVVMAFFTMGSDGFWRQKRLSDERTFVLNKRARASAGGRAKSLKGRHQATASQPTSECLIDAPTPTPTPTKKEDSPSSKYYFEQGVIRLTEKDFNRWKEAFSHLDLAAELIGMAAWAETERSWFNACAGALAKKNRQAKARKEGGWQGDFEKTQTARERRAAYTRETGIL